MYTEEYLGFIIHVGDYLSYTHSKYYEIKDSSGKTIYDTLWNDDKMWKTNADAIASARKIIDNRFEIIWQPFFNKK